MTNLGRIAHNRVDRVGRRYGKLLVMGPVPNRASPKRLKWRCLCDCGNETFVVGYSLQSGNTTSCGCSINEKPYRVSRESHAVAEVLHYYKKHAKERDLEWQLSKEQVAHLIKQPCYYCGKSSSNRVRIPRLEVDFAYNGIDRLDSNQGYTLNNVVPSCKNCNFAKLAMPRSEFEQWAYNVAQYRFGI